MDNLSLIVVRTRTAAKCKQTKRLVESVENSCFSLLNLQNCDVLVIVNVVN